MENEEEHTLVILDSAGEEMAEITIPKYVFEVIVSEGFNSILRKALADYEKEMEENNGK